MKTRVISGLRLYIQTLLLLFLFMAVFRLGFWAFISSDLETPFSADTLKAFYIGLRFDARIAALFTLPLGVLLCIPFFAARLHKAALWLSILYAPAFFCLFTIYCADIGFYGYLGTRVTSLMFELLADFQVAYEMMTQSYPVFPITLGVLAVTAFGVFLFYRLLRQKVRPAPGLGRRAAGFFCGFFIFAFCVYGQLNSSLFPLRWSNAFFTTDEAVIALGLNPVQSIYDTLNTGDGKDYSLEAVREAYPRVAEFLKVDAPNAETLNYARYFPGRTAANGGKPVNVVIVIMESLSFNKTSFAPGNADPTPEIKKLAGESLLFTNFYANARTTARGVFSTMTGIPDVHRDGTASRNPRAVDHRIIGNEFKGYDKFYMIGGNTAWANIRSILGQNIDGLRILEEDFWKSPRADVWGVSDYDLLMEAHELLANRTGDTPFMAVIQTASYHQPFTVPETPGFSAEQMSDEDMLNYSFASKEEYNSMRYVDYAVGEFMRRAKQSPYYENTVFFFFGDHGIKDKVHNMPRGYISANLAPWHVPLIIHAAPSLGLFQPGVKTFAAGQVDVFPTAAGLAGISYTNYTLGRDLLDERYSGSRSTLISGKFDEPLRLITGDYCYFDNRGGGQALFKISADSREDEAAEQPEMFGQMRQLALDLEETSLYLLFNNKKRGGE